MIKHPPGPIFRPLTAAIAASVFAFCLPVHGMVITGYSAAQNNRFASGFPTAPVPNTDPSFIGLGLNWSGAGWNPAQAIKGYGFITPQHYLVARHFGGSTNVTVFDSTGTLQTITQKNVRDTTYGIVFSGETLGDLSLGTLARSVANLARYAILDLNSASGSNSPTSYNNQSLLIYGRGPDNTSSPRIGEATISSVTVSGRNHLFQTTRSSVQLEANDSGSPAFIRWTNPEGFHELTLIGNHAAINDTNNFHNFLGTTEVIQSLNNFVAEDGRAIRIVGTPSNTWVGSSSTDINRNSAWGLGGNPNSNGATSDKFVLFNGSTATNRSVNVNANYNLRGLYFRSTVTTNDPFTFGGTSTLTIGRGGITNYDNDRQNFNAPLTLGSPQYWDAGPGGVRITNLNTNARLLEIRSAGPSEFAGVISGTGGLALESGQLLLSGSATYTGRTWAHSGTLRVTGSIASSQALVLGDFAAVTGSGSLPATEGSGTVSPGNPGADAAILTAPSIHPAVGMDFVFRFSQFAPDFSQPTNAANDVLRLTSPTPFAAAFQAQNRVEIFLDRPELLAGETYRGGFFSHQPDDFFSVIENAEVRIYVPDVAGPVSHEGKNYSIYAGERPLVISTEAQTASIGGSTVNGRILQIEVLPNPAAFEGWAASAFPEEVPEELRTPTADANADGVENLLAYAFGVNPMQPVAQALPFAVVEQVPAGGGEEPETLTKELAFRFHRNPTAQDLLFQVEVSDDLVVWSNWGGAPVVVDLDPRGDGSAELVEVRVPMEQGLERKFARLRVQMAAWQN